MPADDGGATLFPVWTFLVGNGYIFPEPPEGRRRLRWKRAFSEGFLRGLVQAVFRVRLSGGFIRWLQFKNE